MNLDDIFVMANVRTGPKPPSWAEVGTHSLEYTAEAKIDNAIDVRVHGWLKRHGDHLTITWSVVANRDDDALAIGDPHRTTLTVSAAIRGVLRGNDEDALRSEFKEVASKATASCVGRVTVGWGSGI